MLNPITEMLNQFSDPAFGTNYAMGAVTDIFKPSSSSQSSGYENIYDKYNSQEYGLVYSPTTVSELVQLDLYDIAGFISTVQLEPNSIFSALA